MIDDNQVPDEFDSRRIKRNAQLDSGLHGEPRASLESTGAATARTAPRLRDGFVDEDIPADIAAMLDAEELFARETPEMSPDSQVGNPAVPKCECETGPASKEDVKPPAMKAPLEPSTKMPATMARWGLASAAVWVLRWILLVPASLVCGWLAFYVVQIGNRLSMPAVSISPEDFLPRLFIESMSGAVASAVFIILGHRIAPSHKTGAAYGLAGIALVIWGRIAFEAFPVANYWALVRVGGGILGAGAALRSILTVESPLE